MPLHLDRLETDHPELADGGARLQRRIIQLLQVDAPRYRRLWAYYRNPMLSPAVADEENTSARPYRQAQEWGLPSRVVGSETAARKDVVIENDIAWRIDTAVDFLFGQPLVISSAVEDESRRAQIDAVLHAVFAHNGGVAFLQKLAVLGAVYGFVDVLVKYVPAEPNEPDAEPCGTQLLGGRHGGCETIDLSIARRIRFEIVEPTRALPIVNDVDQSGTGIVAYAQVYTTPRPACDRGAVARNMPWLDALKTALLRRPTSSPFETASQNDRAQTIEIIAPHRWQRYVDGTLVADRANSLGRVPIVHVQNAVVPFEYAGASDVEPLIPLQDELNLRLSDRAYRITMQSAKMYLGVNVEDFDTLPIGPGRQWVGLDKDADIIEFGGDANCPSEQAHVDEIREALDKTSGVSPIAAGAIKGRIGRLSSAAALRVTLLALLGRTERKRTTYGPAIAQLCELALAWLDRAGLFATTPAERRVNLFWPNPIPANEAEQIDNARAKQSLGIDPAEVARELGY